MRKLLFYLFILTCVINVNAQITIKQDIISFSSVNVGSKDSNFVYLYNNYNKNISIVPKNLNPAFRVSPASLSINAHDSVLCYVVFTPFQNITEKDIIMFELSDSSNSTVLSVTGNGHYNDLYDSFTYNLFDNELRTALTNYTNNHTSLGYNTARDKMFETIDDRGGDTIECIYTGIKIKAITRTEAQNQGFNTEHTWPQSLFTQNEPMRSDLNHLFPTEDNANNKRSNYPFGIVVNATWSQGGSKLGTNSVSETVFEPRDITKGDIARAMIYFITRYNNNYGSFYSAYEDQICRLWNKTDPVSAYELQRNGRVAQFQGKRNPYIDHPEFVDRIYSFTSNTTRPTVPLIALSQGRLQFDSTTINTTTVQSFYIVNTGTAPLTISNILADDAAYTIGTYSGTIAANSFQKIEVSFTPTQVKNYNGTLTIISNDGFKSLDIKGAGKTPSGINNNSTMVSDYKLFQNYPNPFNASTVIKFSVKEKQNVKIKLFDILGNEITTLYSGEAESGVNSFMFNADRYSSGMYIYSIITKDFTQSKVMTLLK